MPTPGRSSCAPFVAGWDGERRRKHRAYIGGGVTDRLLDAREVAEWLGVPVSWVRESTRSGAMPCVELGRYRRYVRADVQAWLEGCKQPGRLTTLRRARWADS